MTIWHFDIEVGPKPHAPSKDSNEKLPPEPCPYTFGPPRNQHSVKAMGCGTRTRTMFREGAVAAIFIHVLCDRAQSTL